MNHDPSSPTTTEQDKTDVDMATATVTPPPHTPTPSSASSANLVPDTNNLNSHLTLTNHDDILHNALKTVRFLELLGTDSNLDRHSAEGTRPPVLRHLYGFLLSSLNEYWGRLLPAKASIEYGARLAPDEAAAEAFKTGIDRKFKQLEEAPGIDFDRERWPDFDMVVYRDALSRNIMASLVVVDESKQGLFGGDGEGGIYQFGEEVKAFAKGLAARPGKKGKDAK